MIGYIDINVFLGDLRLYERVPADPDDVQRALTTLYERTMARLRVTAPSAPTNTFNMCAVDETPRRPRCCPCREEE